MNKKCFTRHHLKGSQYHVWDYAKAISHKAGVFHLSGLRVAKQLRLSKNTVYGAVRALLMAGWFKRVGQHGRRKDGTFEGQRFIVLSHAEWIAENPGQCRSGHKNCEAPRDVHTQELVMGDSQQVVMDLSQESVVDRSQKEVSYPSQKSGNIGEEDFRGAEEGLTESDHTHSGSQPSKPAAEGVDVKKTATPSPSGLSGNGKPIQPPDAPQANEVKESRRVTTGPIPSPTSSPRTPAVRLPLSDDGYLMGRIQEAFQEVFGRPLQSTGGQRKKLVDLASQFTPDILLGAFELWLQEVAEEALVFKREKNEETGEEEVTYRIWPLNEFLENGWAQSYVQKVTPYGGITGWPLTFLAGKRISPSEITTNHVNALRWLYDHNKHHAFELVYNVHLAEVPFTVLLSNAARYCQELVAKLHAKAVANTPPSDIQAEEESFAKRKRRASEVWQEYAPIAEQLNDSIHSLPTV